VNVGTGIDLSIRELAEKVGKVVHLTFDKQLHNYG